MPCAKVKGDERFTHADFWADKFEEREVRVKSRPKTLGQYGFKEYLMMDEYASKVADILWLLTDQKGLRVNEIADGISALKQELAGEMRLVRAGT